MGGRVALEVVAHAPERVSRLALLDTGFAALAQGEAGDREKAGRYRLLEIAQRDGMLAMARDWARGMVHPARLTDLALMEAIHSMIAGAGGMIVPGHRMAAFFGAPSPETMSVSFSPPEPISARS